MLLLRIELYYNSTGFFALHTVLIILLTCGACFEVALNLNGATYFGSLRAKLILAPLITLKICKGKIFVGNC
jgi:hypothetical protein